MPTIPITKVFSTMHFPNKSKKSCRQHTASTHSKEKFWFLLWEATKKISEKILSVFCASLVHWFSIFQISVIHDNNFRSIRCQFFFSSCMLNYVEICVTTHFYQRFRLFSVFSFFFFRSMHVSLFKMDSVRYSEFQKCFLLFRFLVWMIVDGNCIHVVTQS